MSRRLHPDLAGNLDVVEAALEQLGRDGATPDEIADELAKHRVTVPMPALNKCLAHLADTRKVVSERGRWRMDRRSGDAARAQRRRVEGAVSALRAVSPLEPVEDLAGAEKPPEYKLLTSAADLAQDDAPFPATLAADRLAEQVAMHRADGWHPYGSHAVVILPATSYGPAEIVYSQAVVR